MTKRDEAKRAEAAKLASLYRMMGAEERAKPEPERSRWRPGFSLPSFSLPAVKLPRLALPAMGRAAPTPPISLAKRPTQPPAAPPVARSAAVPASALARPPLQPRPAPLAPPMRPVEQAAPSAPVERPKWTPPIAPPAATPRVPPPAPRSPIRKPDFQLKLPRLSLPKVSLPTVSFPRLSFPSLPRGGAIAAGFALVLGVGVVSVRFWPSSTPVHVARNAPAVAPAQPSASEVAAPVQPAPPPATELAAVPAAPVEFPVPFAPPTAVAPVATRPAAVVRTPAGTRQAVVRVDRRPVPATAARSIPETRVVAPVAPPPPPPVAKEVPPIDVDVAQLAAADTKPVYTESKNVVQVDKKQARRAQRDAASDAIRALRLR